MREIPGIAGDQMSTDVRGRLMERIKADDLVGFGHLGDFADLGSREPRSTKRSGGSLPPGSYGGSIGGSTILYERKAVGRCRTRFEPPRNNRGCHAP